MRQKQAGPVCQARRHQWLLQPKPVSVLLLVKMVVEAWVPCRAPKKAPQPAKATWHKLIWFLKKCKTSCLALKTLWNLRSYRSHLRSHLWSHMWGRLRRCCHVWSQWGQGRWSRRRCSCCRTCYFYTKRTSLPREELCARFFRWVSPIHGSLHSSKQSSPCH